MIFGIASALDHQRAGRWMVAGWVLLTLVAMLARPLGADLAYHTEVAVRLMEGARLYRDIATSVPPFLFYLTLAPAWLAQETGLDLIATVQASLAVLALASLWLANRVLAATPAMPRILRRVLVMLLAFHFFVFDPLAITLAQYYGLILFMPYLALAFFFSAAGDAARAQGASPLWGERIAVVLLLAMALVQCPQFLPAVLAVEAAICWRRGSLACLFRLENALLIVLLVLAALMMEKHLDGLVGTALGAWWERYGAWQRNLYGLRFDLRLAQILVCVAALVLLLRAFPHPSAGRGFVVLAAAAALAALDLDQSELTAFLHYGAAAAVLANLALGAALTEAFCHAPTARQAVSLSAASAAPSNAAESTRHRPAARAGALAAALAALSLLGGTAWTHIYQPLADQGRHSPWRRALDSALKAHAVDAPAFAFASEPDIAFPAIALAGARYPYRHRDLARLGAFYGSTDPLEGPAPYRRPAAQGAEERALFQSVVAELIATPPLVVAVDSRRLKPGFGVLSFDFIDYFTRDPRFAELWKSYALLVRSGPIEIYRLVPERGADR